MNRTIRGFAVFFPLLVLLIPPVDARIYRWVDDHGMVHYSTTPPPSAADRDLRILDGEGRERGVRPSAADRQREAEARERERQEAEVRERELAQRQAEAAARAARERQLRAAYANLEEIREHRDRRLQMVENTLMLSERQEATLQSELDRITAQMQNPRVDERTMQRYRSELADLQSRIERELIFQQRQRAIHDEINANADADIRDFEELVINAPR